MEASRTGVGVEHFGGTASATDPFLVRAVPLQAKPLPLGQLQLIQSFLHVVPQGRKMVDEVSWGLGAGAVEGWALLHWWGLFLPCTAPFLENHSFPFSPLPSPLSFSGPAAHLPPLPCPGRGPPGGQSHCRLCRAARPEGGGLGIPEEAGRRPA